ncbi:MAG TPA: hypothetical protein PKK68_02590 [Methanothrix soehngenii]|nr:hypothetical protein [Methanothrix soehngenii]
MASSMAWSCPVEMIDSAGDSKSALGEIPKVFMLAVATLSIRFTFSLLGNPVRVLGTTLAGNKFYYNYYSDGLFQIIIKAVGEYGKGYILRYAIIECINSHQGLMLKSSQGCSQGFPASLMFSFLSRLIVVL